MADRYAGDLNGLRPRHAPAAVGGLRTGAAASNPAPTFAADSAPPRTVPKKKAAGATKAPTATKAAAAPKAAAGGKKGAGRCAEVGGKGCKGAEEGDGPAADGEA